MVVSALPSDGGAIASESWNSTSAQITNNRLLNQHGRIVCSRAFSEIGTLAFFQSDQALGRGLSNLAGISPGPCAGVITGR
ncbi:hypothetical protein D3C85_1264580 [compost metagenome]